MKAEFNGCFTKYQVEVEFDESGGDTTETVLHIRAPNRRLSIGDRCGDGEVQIKTVGDCERATFARVLKWAAEQIREESMEGYLEQVTCKEVIDPRDRRDDCGWVIKPPRWPVWGYTCGYCGAENQDEDPHYRLDCPTCYREGCSYCMPLGRGCECPECEDSGNEDD